MGDLPSTRRTDFEAVAAEVYEPLQRYLHRRCPAADVDDLFNEVLTVLWRRADDVPPGGEVPWAYGIARRCLANRHRGARRRLRLVDRVASSEPEANRPVWTSELDVALQGALDRLGEPDREVIRLWAWERLEPREIAVVIGSTANAVSVRLTRARGAIAADLEKSGAIRKDPDSAGQVRGASHEETGR